MRKAVCLFCTGLFLFTCQFVFVQEPEPGSDIQISLEGSANLSLDEEAVDLMKNNSFGIDASLKRKEFRANISINQFMNNDPLVSTEAYDFGNDVLIIGRTGSMFGSCSLMFPSILTNIFSVKRSYWTHLWGLELLGKVSDLNWDNSITKINGTVGEIGIRLLIDLLPEITWEKNTLGIGVCIGLTTRMLGGDLVNKENSEGQYENIITFLGNESEGARVYSGIEICGRIVLNRLEVAGGWVYLGNNVDGLSNGRTIVNIKFRGNLFQIFIPDSAIFGPQKKPVTYHLAVEEGSGSGDYKAGKQVLIQAYALSDKNEFKEWVGDVEYLEDKYANPTLVTMPKKNIKVIARFTAKDEE